MVDETCKLAVIVTKGEGCAPKNKANSKNSVYAPSTPESTMAI